MKTRIALAAYYLSITCLVVFAGIIALKLVFWPPCTQIGHNCVVDGWSIAGLAATVLAVAATILAILGAVAVAAWWVSLNDRVNDQVKKLYEAQKTEQGVSLFDVCTSRMRRNQAASIAVKMRTKLLPDHHRYASLA